MQSREAAKTVRCPVCGRTVAVVTHPDYGRITAGHRKTMPHTPETPWCEGGGRAAK